ncbi:YceI family protein [Streptomyces sp. A7024]|uniref:YceI family protein n=1 Tax=Streptomyces coryli TaxID=1128680 RepID=A0A6G4U8P2_9ACTN|nr:YceI family protein [Streptomyces coryli]NGN68554.1 YceI family protein [Streptomyces coryli]
MTTATTIPGYLTGTWTIDPIHSDASFTVRHLGISKVRGRFDNVEGTIVTAENPLESSVTATIPAASVNTNNDQRDAHVRAEDFLDVENHPTLTFRSTGVRAQDEETFLVDGDLTLRGVTRPTTLKVEIGGFGDGLQGGKVIGLSASTEINRKDFGITGGPAGAAVSEKITISLDIEAVQGA